LTAAWGNLVDTATAEVLERIRASEDFVLTSVAEAKALLLGLLEQMKGDFKELRQRIESVSRWLLSAAQTTQEAQNIFSRMAVETGADIDPAEGQLRLAALVGGADAMNSVVLALKSDPSPGFQLAFVDDSAYRFSKDMGTHLAWKRSGFGANNNHIV
jgi:hypothetical protein